MRGYCRHIVGFATTAVYSSIVKTLKTLDDVATATTRCRKPLNSVYAYKLNDVANPTRCRHSCTLVRLIWVCCIAQCLHGDLFYAHIVCRGGGGLPATCSNTCFVLYAVLWGTRKRRYASLPRSLCAVLEVHSICTCNCC